MIESIIINVSNNWEVGMKKKKIYIRMFVAIGAVVVLFTAGLMVRKLLIATASDDKLMELKSRDSRWFDLSAENGLTVCVWYLERDNNVVLQCGLLEGLISYDDPDRFCTKGGASMGLCDGVTPEEMKLILSTYGLETEKVVVIPWFNPCSSRVTGFPSAEQMQTVKELILGTD